MDLLNMKWMSRAACADANIPHSWFFTEGAGYSKPTLAAKRICATCPVAEECLLYGNATRSVGIWGGLGEKSRRSFR